MGTSVKNNIISLIVTGALFVVSSVIFVIFANSKEAKNSDIDVTKGSSDNMAVYYSVTGGTDFKEVKEKATGDFGKSFSDIVVRGELSDTNGNIDFTMQDGKITASYVNQSVAPSSYGYDSLVYDIDKEYSVDSDVSGEESYYGFVCYPDDSSDSSESGDVEGESKSKEKCKYLESSSDFNLVMCEDTKNVYTTINTAQENRENESSNIKNNALYKFDKESKETKKLCDLNIHTEGKYIEGIACNDKYIYILVNAAEKYEIKVFDKDDYEEKKSQEIDIYVDMEALGKKLTGEYSDDVRKISNHEIQDGGYELSASEEGLVILKKVVIAELDANDPKHYGEKGYSTAYEKKGLEPFVKEVYAVSSFSTKDGDVKLDNTHVCVTPFIYDYIMYKNGLTYILTNIYSTDSDVLEKVKVTSLSNGKIFEEININLNKISNTSGAKNLKYLQIR